MRGRRPTDVKGGRSEKGSGPGFEMVGQNRGTGTEGGVQPAATRCRRSGELEGAGGLRQASEHLHGILALRHGFADGRRQEAGGADRSAATAESQERVPGKGGRRPIPGLPESWGYRKSRRIRAA